MRANSELEATDMALKPRFAQINGFKLATSFHAL